MQKSPTKETYIMQRDIIPSILLIVATPYIFVSPHCTALRLITPFLHKTKCAYCTQMRTHTRTHTHTHSLSHSDTHCIHPLSRTPYNTPYVHHTHPHARTHTRAHTHTRALSFSQILIAPNPYISVLPPCTAPLLVTPHLQHTTRK